MDGTGASAWTGRGIDPKLRDAALEAARRHGLPVGGWLSQGKSHSGDTPPDMDGDDGGGAPINERRIAEAIDRLTQRIDATEQRANLAVVGLDRGLIGLASRLDETETGAREEALRLLTALGELKDAQTSLQERVARAESGGEAQARLEAALKAVDRQLGALSAHVHDSEARAHADIAALRTDISAKLADLDAKAQRSQHLEASLSDLDSRLTADVERRIHEVGQKSAVDLATLRSDIHGLFSLAQEAHRTELDARLLQVDSTVGNALRQLENTVRSAEARLSSNEQQSAAAMHGLQARFAEIDARLAGFSGDRAAPQLQIDDLKFSLEARLEQAKLDLSQELLNAKAGFANQVAQAVEGMRPEEVLGAVSDVNRRIAAAERRQAQTIEAVSVEIKRISEAIDTRLRAVETRGLTGAQGLTQDISQASERLEQRFRDLDARESELVTRMSQDLGRLSQQLQRRMDDAEDRSTQAATQLGQQLNMLADSLTKRQDALAQDLAERLVESEERSATRLQDTMHAVGSRLAEIEHRTDASLTPVQKAMSTLAARLQAIEERSEHTAQTLAPQRPQAPEPPPPVMASQPVAAPPPIAEPPPFADLPPVEAEDPLMDLASDTAAWETKPAPAPAPVVEPAPVAESEPAPIAEHPLNDELFGLEPEPKKPAKDDYLAAARRAAQAGAAGSGRRVSKPDLGPRTADKSAVAEPGAEKEKPARFGLLRGLQLPPRTIGLAGAVALAAAGGGYFYLNQQQSAQTAQAAGAPAADGEALPIASTSSSEGATRAGPAPPLAPATLAAAAEKGDSVAQYLVAEDAIRSGDAAKGLNLLQRAANQGLAAAQYRLAKVYERGEGVAMDLNQARQWTERAAVAGNVKAMHDLGVYYARGEGAPFDETQAARWFRQAAEFGVADSQFNLAVLFQQGRGVQANASEAMFWYMVAAKGGDADAGARAESLGATMSASDVQSVRARAAAFTPKPSNPRANGQFSAMAAAPAQTPG